MGDLSNRKKSSIKHVCSLFHKWRHHKFHVADGVTISSPTLLVRTTSHVVPIPNPNSPRNASDHVDDGVSVSFDDYEGLRISSPTLLVRTTGRIADELNRPSISRRKSSSPEANTPKAVSPATPTPILFSQSGVRRKAAPVMKKVECSLEELCFGCVKKINVTRIAMSTNGLLIREEEVLKIRVEPGWQKGTKIMFEGKGDERPGMLPADIIFEVHEKEHPLYKRNGDDLELGVEVPLIEALTGCTLSVPLLDGEELDLMIEDVIHPGYVTIIPEQGMPRFKDGKERGDLRLYFTVEFPNQLTEEQKRRIAKILDECN